MAASQTQQGSSDAPAIVRAHIKGIDQTPRKVSIVASLVRPMRWSFLTTPRAAPHCLLRRQSPVPKPTPSTIMALTHAVCISTALA